LTGQTPTLSLVPAAGAASYHGFRGAVLAVLAALPE